MQAASKANDIEEINGVKVLYVEEQLENAKAKQLTFDFRDQLESGIVVLVSKYEEKCSYFVSVSKDLVGQYKAGNIIKAMKLLTVVVVENLTLLKVDVLSMIIFLKSKVL